MPREHKEASPPQEPHALIQHQVRLPARLANAASTSSQPNNHALTTNPESRTPVSHRSHSGECEKYPMLTSCVRSLRRSRLSTQALDYPSDITREQPPVAGQYELECMVKTLLNSGLFGPVLLLNEEKYIGQGAQFIVFKQRLVSQRDYDSHEVAVKRPKINLDPDTKFNFAEDAVKKHLTDLYCEIKTLTDPELSRHPNIARLVAWSCNPYTFHSPPELIMELAISTLSGALKGDSDAFTDMLRHILCCDVANGLDALHQARVIHGDLKPENVLLFMYCDRIMAKLADFGLSAIILDTEGAIHSLAGTPGWMAPEVEAGMQHDLLAMELADNYSLGLLVWSVMLYAGDSVPNVEVALRHERAQSELSAAAAELGYPSLALLASAVHTLLQPEVDDRARSPVLDLLCSEGISGQLRDTYTIARTGYGRQNYDVGPCLKFPWELRPVPYVFLPGLYERMIRCPDSIPADILFSMFLCFSRDDFTSMGNHGQSLADRKTKALDSLSASALLGYVPAQAVIERAYRFYDATPPSMVKESFASWKFQAALKGDFLARIDLQQTEPLEYQKAMRRAKRSGGYNQFYSTPFESPLLLTLDQELFALYHKDEQLCLAAGWHPPERMAKLLTSPEINNLEQRNRNRESPLYLACARGCLTIAEALLGHAADPSFMCNQETADVHGISPLHWAIAFEIEEQSSIVELLVAHGAHPNPYITESLPIQHYPFSLPAGTPLHWAVVTCSHEAVRALLRCGGNVHLRDCQDAYARDGRVRILNRADGPNQELSSSGDGSSFACGLSCLDLAAMQHDPFLFEALLETGAAVDINHSDEEGLTAVHRLSHGFVRHTDTGNGFNIGPFLQSPRESRGKHLGQRLERTVRALGALGADFERLSKVHSQTSSRPDKAGGRNRRTDLGSYTPLMYAVCAGNVEVARALLDAGASVNTVNERGVTALGCCTCDCRNPEAIQTCISLLLDRGASVHQRDNNGTAPIVRVASPLTAPAIELFVEAGASLTEISLDPDDTDRGAGILHRLAMNEDAFRQDNDLAVVRLLERHVFSLPTAEQKQVIELATTDGETILHRYAEQGMLNSVKALVAHEADVNALCYETRASARGHVRVRQETSWYETPLDRAVGSRDYREEEMEKSRRYSAREYHYHASRQNAIIQLLRDVGAKETRPEQESRLPAFVPKDWVNGRDDWMSDVKEAATKPAHDPTSNFAWFLHR